MIFSPRIGQRVRLHYGKPGFWPHHGKAGTVEVSPKRGIRNIGVRLDDGILITVPRGNLVSDERESDE